jgi:hypothetical protein
VPAATQPPPQATAPVAPPPADEPATAVNAGRTAAEPVAAGATARPSTPNAGAPARVVPGATVPNVVIPAATVRDRGTAASAPAATSVARAVPAPDVSAPATRPQGGSGPGHAFVSGLTRVESRGLRASRIPGFETAGLPVKRKPATSGRLEMALSPGEVQPGQPYRLRVYLVNDGRKPIQISGVSIATIASGARAGVPARPLVRRVAPRVRALVADVTGVWPQSVQSWSAEGQLTASNGDRLVNELVWR